VGMLYSVFLYRKRHLCPHLAGQRKFACVLIKTAIVVFHPVLRVHKLERARRSLLQLKKDATAAVSVSSSNASRIIQRRRAEADWR
jgi:hypothetical protein